MNNIVNGIKRFLSNKNTVTVIGVLLAVFVLYVGYNMRIKAVTAPVRIPYARVTIQPRTEITEDMIAYMDVPKRALQGKIMLSSSRIIGQFSNYNTIIPEGSMFYNEAVIDFRDLPDAALQNVEEGYTVYNLPVNIETTYGNSLFPGNSIDVYFKGVSDSNEIMYGQLFSKVKILEVKDSKGMSVFRRSDELGVPAMLLFAVPNDMYLILKKAAYLAYHWGNKGELVVVPVTEKVETTPGVTSSFLVDFINAKTAAIPQDQIDQIYQNPTLNMQETE